MINHRLSEPNAIAPGRPGLISPASSSASRSDDQRRIAAAADEIIGIGDRRGFGAPQIDERQANSVARRLRTRAPVKPKPAISVARLAGSGIAVIVNVPAPGSKENGVVAKVPNLKIGAFSVPVDSGSPAASITTLGLDRA